jgi:hypothetical protein
MKMNDAQRRLAILNLIERRTAEDMTSKAAARESLIRDGIYTQKGKLRSEFGGGKRKGKSTA